MSALRAARPQGKRPPTFTTYTEVDVDIDPSELERAGWVYVGHDDTHDGPWRWCQHELCDALRGREAV